MQYAQVLPHGLIHFVASDSVGHLHLGLLFIFCGSGGRRVHVNGLNSELTPAWRGREAVIHVNQPTCFYLEQNKVKFCSSSCRRSDETLEFRQTQVQSSKAEVCYCVTITRMGRSFSHSRHYSDPERFIIGTFGCSSLV